MPPWLDSAEEVAALVTAVIVAIGAVVAALVTAIAGVIAVYRAKIKPMLSGTQQAAQQAAYELRANHGSSTRDAINRTEKNIDHLIHELRDMRTEQRTDRDAGNRAHSEIFRRMRQLETPMEDTRP